MSIETFQQTTELQWELTRASSTALERGLVSWGHGEITESAKTRRSRKRKVLNREIPEKERANEG